MTDNRGVLESVRAGEKGKILVYVRPNRRSPARDFRQKMTETIRGRFNHVFRQVCSEGLTKAASHFRLAPLTKDGKGLWSFKEADCRFFGFRAPTSNGLDQVVLLNGWVKDHTDSIVEKRVIAQALMLKDECLKLVDWVAEPVPYGSTKMNSEPLPLAEQLAFQKDPTPEEVAKHEELQSTEVPEAKPGDVLFIDEVCGPFSKEKQQELMRFAEAQAHKLEEPPARATVTTLVALSGAKRDMVQRLLNAGKLPGGEQSGWNNKWSWPWAKVDELVAIIKGHAAAPRKGGQHLLQADGKYHCPRCDKPFDTGGQAAAHLTHCSAVSGVVLTRVELLKLAEKVIDGKCKLEDFGRAIEIHNLKVKELAAAVKKLQRRK
jgi:hypothetical protein